MPRSPKHKIQQPLRPIVSSINSISEGAEIFLGKGIFSDDIEIISMDAVLLFTNIHIERVVDYIINIIYKTKDSAREFFNETRSNDDSLEV